MKTRSAAVEGRFYPPTKQRIFDQIRMIENAGRYPGQEIRIEKVIGAVLPHAGHIYSGHQTVPFFQLLRKHGQYPETFVIIHPNHTGYGLPLAIDDSDVWSNSIGEISLDREFAGAMDLPCDRMAHAREHSAEVIIPFIQYYLEECPFGIVPVCMGDQGYDQAALVAESILKARNATGRKILVLASSDFSHYLAPEEGRRRDQFVLDEILARNASGVEQAVKRHRISVCGYGPIMALMDYAGSLHSDYGIHILARGSSGDVAQAPEVVDYISMIFYH
jgi:AmmeMemoRadiSam system protein B